MPAPNVLRSEEKATGAIQTFTLVDNDSLLRMESNHGFSPVMLHRVSGDKGFDGTWEGQVNVNDTLDMQIDSRAGGLVFSTPDSRLSEFLDLRLDSKAYLYGTSSSKHDTISSHRVNDHTIEVVYASNNKTQYTDHYLLSKDGSVLTVVSSIRTLSTPAIFIYKRRELPSR
jgi:hypothetical protein